MPVDLPPKGNDGEIAPADGVLARILNWTAVVICIGLCWWAVVYGLWEPTANFMSELSVLGEVDVVVHTT